ncbi:hypothetical protein NIES2119_19035 [[Phormidium ambiguum] IAM M-71]|uniref:Uncharacterized protein n=1 Tax=[Phormidium ambiguum] IAM M-71 TaxID=454136 RepID=A0A1U7IFR1_9CYAN|nr:hypothetical protein [Phormidium ambiguum]OKH35838.1 hypothetical protein NIES2119_19035 [Phormidium ambiguum IAM M-71]
MELLEYLQKYQDNLNLTVDTCPGLVRQKFWLINAQEELQIIKNNYGDLLEDEIDIDSLIFEANWLKEITSDLLSDDDFLIELEWGRETSIKEQLKQLEKSLKITLEIDNEQALRQQLQQIQLYQDQIREIQLKLDKSTQTLAESDNEVEIIKKLIYLLEAAVFSIEGYNDDGELLIAYGGQIKTIKSIIEQDCEVIKLLSNTLLGQANNLRKQAEQSIKQLEEERRRQAEQEKRHQVEEQRQRETTPIRIQNEQIKAPIKRIRFPIKPLLAASTVAALGYAGWTSGIATPQIQQLLNNVQLSQNTDEQKPNFQLQTSASLETAQKPNAEQQTSVNLAVVQTLKPESQTSTNLEISQRLNSEQETSVNLEAIQKPNAEQQATTNLETAQKLAMEAAVMTQNSPHPLEIWQKSQAKWQEAVNILEVIPENLAISAKAKEKLANYRINFTAISNRIITEEKASTNLETAQKLAMEASVMVQNPSQSAEVWQQAKAKWQEAIRLLEAIPSNTFVSAQAQDKLTLYRTNYAVVSKK